MIINTEFDLDEDVWDDLIHNTVKIVGISFERGYTKGDFSKKAMGNTVYWVSSPYLGGARHPWELTHIYKDPLNGTTK